MKIHSPIDPHRDQQVTFRGYTVLLTNRDGSITEGKGLGLFDYDTRILSKYRLLIDDEPPRCDTSTSVESDFAIAFAPVGSPANAMAPGG